MKDFLNNILVNEIIIDKVGGLFYMLDFKVKELIELASLDFAKSHDVFKKVNRSCRATIALSSSDKQKKTSRINTEEVLNALNVIHKNLQFNDIINQRLVHVQQIHQSVIGQVLGGLSANKTQSNKDVLKIIQKVSDLSVNQLISLSLDYQTAFDTISDQLNSIKRQLKRLKSTPDWNEEISKTVSLIDYYLKYNETQNLFSSSLKHGMSLLQSFSSDLILNFGWQESDNEMLMEVEKMYTMESERVIHNKITGKGSAAKQMSTAEGSVDLF